MDYGTKTKVWDWCIMVLQVCSNEGHLELPMSLQEEERWRLRSELNLDRDQSKDFYQECDQNAVTSC